MNLIFLVSFRMRDSKMKMCAYQCYWARQPWYNFILVVHSHWPWLSATRHIFTTLLHVPTPSFKSCPLPVIACQINVPLCSQAQKLSCRTGLLFPTLFFFPTLVLPHTPTATASPSLGVYLLCFSIASNSFLFSASKAMSSPASSLSSFLQALHLFCHAASAVLSALSLPSR